MYRNHVIRFLFPYHHHAIPCYLSKKLNLKILIEILSIDFIFFWLILIYSFWILYSILFKKE